MHMTKKTRNTMKPPSQNQSSPVFEGVYSNARMLHFLTAVVGSTCDVQVKNGAVYEGIFKTLSSQCDLAVDAVHKCSDGVTAGEGEGGGGGGEEGGGGDSPEEPPSPKIEEITDTMVFSPADLVTMTCRDVDLNFAIRGSCADTFTDTAISSSRVNGEHREKVLQRWDAGDSNGESYDLESDAANGWDANEMFKSHEETYGVKSTYDSSLSMYTVPLERGTSDMFRQREARAARLATEIESSPQYRRRVSLENTDGKTEEEKFSAVLRGDREDQRGASPGFSSSGREGKYIPLPQRAREMGAPSAGGGGRGTLGGSGRLGGGPASSSRYAPPPGSSPSSSSSRYAPPPGSSPSSSSSSDRSSPLSVRTAYSPHQQGSPAAGGSPTPSSSSSHLPHSLSHPQALSDAAAARSAVNGVVSRTSPKSQRPQSNRTLRTPNSQSSPAVSRSPKPENAPAQDLPLAGPAYLDSSPSSDTTATSKTCGPTPLFPVDVNEILISAAKERMEGLAAPQEGKNSKTPSVQQRTQLEELRKFGKEFRLQPSSSSSSSANLASLESSSPAGVAPQMVDSRPAQDQQIPEAVSCSTATLTPPTPMPGVPQSVRPDRQSAGTPQPSSGTLATVDPRPDSVERTNNSPVAVVQVKNSTLNPNAKEFLPIKAPTVLQKPAPTPTPPRPTPPSPSLVLAPPPGPPQGGGQPGVGPGAIYSSPPGPYLSYVFPNSIHGHPVQAVSQAPQMYQYMSTVAQSKYPRAKGPVVGPRAADHHASQTQANMMQVAASAAGAPLVASPYQSYLQYGQVLQAMPPHYHGQPMYSMLQGGARMLTSPQGMGHPGPPYPGQTEGPQGPQQAMYAPQAFSHHTGGSMHHPQPSSTPTGSQPQPQHTAPSPGHAQSGQGGPQPQSMYHSSTPPSLPPGHSSPQASYPMQSYSLQAHQHMAHGFPTISQLQAHVAGGMSGPHHHSAGPPPPQVMLHYAAAPQQGGANAPQHGPPPQQGTHQHYYIGHPQALQVQAHPSQQLSFHPAGN